MTKAPEDALVEQTARAIVRASCDPLIMSEIAIGLYVDKRWREKIPEARAALTREGN